jgi:iron(III) transport system permease protein
VSLLIGAAPSSRFRGRLSSDWLVTGLIYGSLAVTVIWPVAMVIVPAFLHDGKISFDAVTDLFESGEVLRALVNTLLISVFSVILATGIGVTLAWLVGRTNMPFKRVFDTLNMMPFYLSSVVGALSWQAIAAPRSGLLNSLLHPIFGHPVFDIYSIGGMALVLGLFYAPYIYLFTLGSLQSMDISLEEAARMSGAGVFQTALRVTLPLSGPAILSASILVFVISAGIFGVPLLLGVPSQIQTISTLIYRSINNYPADFSAAAAMSILLVVITGALLLVQASLLRGRRFTTVTGKGYRTRVIDLGRWRWLGAGINGLYLLLVLAPFVVLVLVSLQNAWTGSFEFTRFTLRNFNQVLFVDAATRRGFLNSMIISPIGATIAVAVCLALALVLHRTRLPGRTGILAVSMLPVTIPGVVLGLGFLAAGLTTPLYGTIWLIMIAYIVHFLPTGLRNMESAVQSISQELDESARMSGASWWKAMTAIIVPLITPGLISLWLLLFITFVREVSASMMLYTYGTETMSIALINIMEYAPFGVAGAFGVLQTLLLLACVALIRLVPAGRKA